MFAYGVLLTLLYFFILGITILGLDLDPVSSWNELGDFLAGAFSPVAFLWLILGYLQQQRELQQNTQALMLQAEELRGSVEQASQMVVLTREQLDFEKEKNAIQMESYKSENSPNLSLRLGPVSEISRDIKTNDLVLWNHGKQASRFELFHNGQAFNFNLTHLGNEQNFKFRHQFSVPSLPRNDVITIKCLNIFGEECVFDFDVHVDSKGKLEINPRINNRRLLKNN